MLAGAGQGWSLLELVLVFLVFLVFLSPFLSPLLRCEREIRANQMKRTISHSLVAVYPVLL